MSVVCDMEEQRSVKCTPAGRVVGKTNIAAKDRIQSAIALEGCPCVDRAGIAKPRTGESKGAGGRMALKVLVGLGLCFRTGASQGAQGKEGEEDWQTDVFYFR